MNAPAVSREVAQRYHALRRRHLYVRVSIAVAIAAILLLAIWTALAASDYYGEWPLVWRRAGMILGTAVVAIWLMRRLWIVIRDTRQRRFTGQLEGRFTEFGQRIRTVLDTVDGRAQGPAAMLAALGHQTLGRWEIITPARIIPTRTLAVCGGMCLLSIVLTAGLFNAGEDWRSAMLRAIGDNRPYTSLAVTPGDASVLENSPVEVSLVLRGRIHRDVSLRYRTLPTPNAQQNPPDLTEQQWIESELLAEERGTTERHPVPFARFTAQLGKAADAIEYQFVTSVGTTPLYHIHVRPLIEAQRMETTVEPPQYTQLETRTFTSSNVTVLEQSVVTVAIGTNHPLREARLSVGDTLSNLKSLKIVPGEDRTLWTFQLPSSKSLHWTFSGAGHDGTPMTQVKGRLRIRQDAPPTLTWRDPPDEMRVHTLAELPMRLQISDDFGIGQTAIVFQMGGDDEYVLTDWSADSVDSESSANTTRLRLEKILPLESFALSERDYISYYAYAVDNRSPAFHRSETDVRYIDIRPLRQYFSEVEMDPATGPRDNGVLVQLDELIRRQRFLINRTRKLVRGSNGDLTHQLGLIDRMVESQSELAGLTRFLAEFFVSQGSDDVEALSQAEAAMLQAADSLAAAGFDLALIQQEDALRALAEARRTLEVRLRKNPTPQQRQAMQKFARQLRQKLRRDTPASEQQLADSLMKIATEQAQLGQSAARLMSQQASSSVNGSNGGGSGDKPESDQNVANGEVADAQGEQRAGEEQQAELFSRQIDLVERLQAIEDQLPGRSTDSPLMSQRITDAKTAMNDLAMAARDEDLEGFSSATEDVSEQIRELGVQLDALAADEAVTRVSSIRDLTTSLANMEIELAEQLRNHSSAGSATPSDDPQNAVAIERRARRMQRRSETIEDVLKAPVEMGDVQTSEVDARLQQFVEESGFLEQLQATQDASQELANEELVADDPSQEDANGQEAHQRALDYADAAYQLEDLYRQLLAPRLARLRDIEQRANQLAQQMAASGEATDPAESAEVMAGVGKLQQTLEEDGLNELAELLQPQAAGDGAVADDEAVASGQSDDRFDPTKQMNLSGRTLFVVKELRERIQEMILLEISADRDAPVPPQYRTAVDQYLRAIAGEADAMKSNATAPKQLSAGAGE